MDLFRYVRELTQHERLFYFIVAPLVLVVLVVSYFPLTDYNFIVGSVIRNTDIKPPDVSQNTVVLNPNILLRKDLPTTTSTSITLSNKKTSGSGGGSSGGGSSGGSGSSPPEPTTTTSTTTTVSTTSTTTTLINLLFLPTVAVNDQGQNQIAPNGGTVNNDDDVGVWLNGSSYVLVSSWDKGLPPPSQIISLSAYCDVNDVNASSGFVTFSFGSFGTWISDVCRVPLQTSPQLYSCNPDLSVITIPIVDIDVKCGISNSDGAYSLDMVSMEIVIPG